MVNKLKQLITDEDNWSVGEGENEGTPFILRYRPHLQEFIATNRYTKHLTIFWSYESDDESLMPDDEETELMGNVEDALAEALETDVQCVLAFVYTGQNQKEWHWYSGDIAETGKRINDALADFDELPIELSADDDPDWAEYKAVLEGSANAEEIDDEEEQRSEEK